MRVVRNSQIQLGELAIAEIRIDPRSRDDIPAVLRGLQEIYTHDEKREQLFTLLEESLTSEDPTQHGSAGNASVAHFCSGHPQARFELRP